MIFKILNGVLMGTYGLSAVITYLINASSNSRIRRAGYDIKPITENSVTENISYGIKDFGYLLVPVWNLIKSIKLWAKKDSEFDSVKIERLTARGRIEKLSSKKDESKKPVVIKKVEKAKEPERVVPTVKRAKTLAEMTPLERKDHYRLEYNRLHDAILQARREKNTELSNALMVLINDIIEKNNANNELIKKENAALMASGESRKLTKK